MQRSETINGLYLTKILNMWREEMNDRRPSNYKIILGIIHCLMLRSYLGNLLILSASNSTNFYHACAPLYSWVLQTKVRFEPHTLWLLAYFPLGSYQYLGIYLIWIHTRVSPSFFIFHQDPRESYRTRLPSSHHFAYSNMGLGMRLGALCIYLHS